MNLKYSCIILAFVFIEVCSLAQNNANSPYTMFGVGYIEPGGFGRNRAMGGTGIALASEVSLNNINPASYHSIDSLHFFFETGLNSIFSDLSQGEQHQKKLNANFSYFAIGFRMKKWWGSSIGIAPYSNIGYSINTRKQIEGTNEFSDIKISGSGGLNHFYWGNSFKLNKNFAVGINASYLFGSVSQEEQTTNNYFSGNIKVEDYSRLTNLYFNYGAQYIFRLNKNWSGVLGGIYGNKTRLSLDQSINITDVDGDTLASELNAHNNFYIPQYYGFGISVKYKDNLVLTTDFTQNNWSGANKTKPGIELVNSRNYAVGIEYMPKHKPSSGYFQLVKYRLGGYIENSYMRINGQQLKDYGVSAGLGFPVMKGKTYINIALTAGFKGVFNSNRVINERYYKLHINFTIFDYWFNRRKFN